MLDTLEEAEYLGTSALLATWKLLGDLLERADRLRIVTAGRSPLPPGFPRNPVPLTALPVDAALQLVLEQAAGITNFKMSKDDATRIVSLVGMVPLCLILAVRVFANEGIDGLRDTLGRRWIFSRMKAEQQQGMLYRRILRHVSKHNPQLEKVVNPGLILRRITPEIIAKVLAGPCELELGEALTAEAIFEGLKRETGLLDQYREPGAVWHLGAVRQVMLADLRSVVGEDTVKLIHQNAAKYYHERPNPTDIERAEGIYHRLWLGGNFSELEKVWDPRLKTHLDSAYQEFEPEAKLWLADKLGIELEDDLRLKVDLVAWERQAERRVRTLLASGLLNDALVTLHERERPDRPSALYALEADTLKLMGRMEEAKEVVARGLAAARCSGSYATMLPLVLREAAFAEADDDLQRALASTTEGLQLAQRLRNPVETLNACVTMLRIIRKLKATGLSPDAARQARALVEYRHFDSIGAKVRETSLSLLDGDPEVRGALNSRPALLRETAAEIGVDRPQFLGEAISQLGISPEDRLALIDYTKSATISLNAEESSALSEVQSGSTARGMGAVAAKLAPAFAEFFAERLAGAVEQSLHRTVKGGTGGPASNKLTIGQLKDFESVIARTFEKKELEVLTRDSFDIEYGNVVDLQKPYGKQINQLLRYAADKGNLEDFVSALVRSRPVQSQIYQAVQQAGILKTL